MAAAFMRGEYIGPRGPRRAPPSRSEPVAPVLGGAQRQEHHDERRERHHADLPAHDRGDHRPLLVPRAARRPPARPRARAGRAPSARRRRAAARRRTPPRAAAAHTGRRGVRSSSCRPPRASPPPAPAQRRSPGRRAGRSRRPVPGGRARITAVQEPGAERPGESVERRTAIAPAHHSLRHARRFRADCHYVTLCHKR